MCIALWSTDASFDYQLDEFLHRPSLPAHWHAFDRPESLPEILSGRDLVGGGTWLGIDRRTGKFAFLTNVSHTLDTSADHEPAISRGNLIRDFLQGADTVQEYISRLISKPQEMMHGYNVVVGQIVGCGAVEKDVELGFHCNRGTEAETIVRLREDGDCVSGISNAIGIHSPAWPKVSLGTRLMARCLESDKLNSTTSSDQTKLERELFNLMTTTDASTEQLSHNILIRPHHRLASPTSKPDHSSWYGTKTQTILLVSQKSSTVTFVERDGFEIERTREDNDDGNSNDLGRPVWRGDDPSKYRRFEFKLSCS